MTKHHRQPDREWSVPVNADDIPSHGKEFSLTPSEAECKKIAKRIGLVSLDMLEAKVLLERENGGHIIKATGSLEAQLTQSCVVTLEPVKDSLSEEFEAWFADHSKALPFKRAQREALSKREMMDLPILEEQEDPEPIEDGKIDLGELVVQYLSLAVNPYPHKEGVDYENKEVERKTPAKDTLRPNPFAALKNWRPKD